MRKSVIVAIIAVVVIVVAAIVIAQQVQQREALRNVQFSIEKVEVVKADLGGATANITVRITNPNSVTATLDRADYSLTVNNISVGSGSTMERIDVPPGESMTFTTPFKMTGSGAAQSALSYLTQGGVEWRITGTAYFDTPIGAIGTPFNFTGATK